MTSSLSIFIARKRMIPNWWKQLLRIWCKLWTGRCYQFHYLKLTRQNIYAVISYRENNWVLQVFCRAEETIKLFSEPIMNSWLNNLLKKKSQGELYGWSFFTYKSVSLDLLVFSLSLSFSICNIFLPCLPLPAPKRLLLAQSLFHLRYHRGGTLHHQPRLEWVENY